MQISSTIAEWQIEEFMKILKANKIKKSSSEFTKHLVMFGEARAVAKAEYVGAYCPIAFHDDFLIAYKKHWGLV